MAQFIIIKTVNIQFLISSNGSGVLIDEQEARNQTVKQCLVFLPCATFGIAADIQIIASVWKYKPVAFSDLPYKCTRGLLLVIGISTLAVSMVTYGFCLLVFGGLSDDPDIRQWLFIIFIIKAMTWSPFIGLELYDTLFEQIYHDVQFQLNVVKPD